MSKIDRIIERVAYVWFCGVLALIGVVAVGSGLAMTAGLIAQLAGVR
jgi:hypothetical protein